MEEALQEGEPCLLSALEKFAWQFLQLAFDLFLDSKAALSRLRDEEGKGSNRLDVKHKATIGRTVGEERRLCRCPHCKQPFGLLCRINKPR